MALSTVIAIAIFGVLFMVPSSARDVLRRFAGPRFGHTEIERLSIVERQARREFTASDSALAAARSLRAAMEESAERTDAATSEKDSAHAAVQHLEDLITRALNAPLPETYRALAESEQMRGIPRIQTLLDSLADVERQRDELGAAVDPVFVALTARTNALGRAIVAAAQRRLAAMKEELPASRWASSEEGIPGLPDTLAFSQAREHARDRLKIAIRALANATSTNAAAERAFEEQQQSAQLAPAAALLATSIVLAVAMVFGVSLGDEIRSPRVADGTEAERMTDARVLSVVRPRRIPESRMRRASDQVRPALLDPQLDAYRMLAWHVSAHAPRDGILVVTGEVSINAAVVAANIAAVLANEARATLLLDIDFDRGPMAAILEVSAAGGLAAVLENRRRWSESVLPVTTGRGRTLDCIPAGARKRALGPAEREALGSEIQRASRRYDVTIVYAPLYLARRATKGMDAVLCATLSRTRLSTLARAAAGLRDDGARVLGVSLWEGGDIVLPSSPVGVRMATRSAAETRIA